MCSTVRFLKGASVGHGDNPLIRDVSLELEPGTVTRLVGANGVGKSTLIDSALGTTSLIDGEWLYPHRPGSAAYQSEIGYLPSTVAGYPNLALGQWLTLISQGFSVPSRDIHALWEELGGRGDEKTLLGNLSSGNRKKALFVPVVCVPRTAIFLDEPFEEVDLYGQEVMASHIQRQLHEGAAVLIVSHRSVDHLVPVDTTWTIQNASLVSDSEEQEAT